MKTVLFTLGLMMIATTSFAASPEPTLLTGAGSTQSYDSREESPLVADVNHCEVTVDKSQVQIIAELDPGMSGLPVTMNLAKATKSGTPSRTIYKSELETARNVFFCDAGQITGGTQTLTVSVPVGSTQPVYSLKTVMECSAKGFPFTKAYVATCNMNFGASK